MCGAPVCRVMLMLYCTSKDKKCWKRHSTNIKVLTSLNIRCSSKAAASAICNFPTSIGCVSIQSQLDSTQPVSLATLRFTAFSDVHETAK